jgi:hypothetical protein
MMKVNKKLVFIVLLTAAAMMFSSCSMVRDKPVLSTDQSTQALQQKDAKIKALESSLAAQKKSLQDAKAKLSSQQGQVASASSQAPAVSSTATMGSDSLLPPAKPGECYARILIPAKFESKTEKMLKKAESERLEIIPAKYEWVEETIQTEGSSYKLVPVSGNFKTKTTKYQTSEGRRYWATSMDIGAAEANANLLEAAKSGGIDLDSAKVGMCYHEHYIPPTYKIVTEKVISSEASETVQVIPAKYEWSEKRILVKESSFRLVNVPETYKKVSEKVMVEPAKTIWKKGRGPIEKLNNSTGEIVCLVEVPAKYKTVTKTVVATPATTKKVEIPAEYKTIKVKKLVAEAQEKRTVIPATYKTISKKVLENKGRLVWHEVHNKTMSKQTRTGHQICLRETPPTFATYTTKIVDNSPATQKVMIPAKHKTIKVRKLVSPAQTKRVKIPAVYQTVSKRMKVNEEHMEWVPILCETNFNIGLVTVLQQKLKSEGFDPGVIDGDYGYNTSAAVTKYQKKKGLAAGHLTIETLRALGVAYK